MANLDASRAKLLGELIQQARTRLRLTVADCTEALGVTDETFHKIENGDYLLSLPQIEVLAMILHVPMAYFWGSYQVEDETDRNYEQFLVLRNRMIGAFIRQARIEQQVDLSAAARELGMSEEELELLEKGRRDIPFFELERIAKALGVSIDYFTDYERGPMALHENNQRAKINFEDLPPDIQNFVTNPLNINYLETAKRLSEMNVDRLRNIAEGILDITF
ncbi:MAG TPA: helix-turn-helix transcriptional regulator [Anaerolineae bacterium]|nr:helix-turn-helix transcriptional regulator [Anaerolineae bacterium]